MDKKYFDKVNKKIDNLNDEEFLESLKKAGLVECPNKNIENMEELMRNLKFIRNLAQKRHEQEFENLGTDWDDIVSAVENVIKYLEEKED